ncbi:hypothetical protein I6L37_09425 [Aeromonas sp. FDAARGOS 1407]|uniref:hypothetical protein n=1 Tax=Aeromonas sp. FDAARGOS 1407 TaxID=2778056 RepID=UPI001C23C546|nr:hypothetical protein [Aeromonas sp. FDAARGOS 1407]QXC35829.1 hypothetical protein I6L37_09425 [Aeromonas sp. FDAARGOS 1407]
MHQWIIALLGLLLTPAVLAFGDHGRWNDGWGQGVTEYSATVDDATYLYLSCRMGQLSRIELNQAGQAPTETVWLRIDGHTYPPLSGMVAGNDSKAFYDMWAALRSAKSLQAITQDGRTVELPVAGVQETLTAATDAAFGCAFPAPEPEPAAAPLNFELRAQQGVLQVVSRNDPVTINDITINRGQCQLVREVPSNDCISGRVKWSTCLASKDRLKPEYIKQVFPVAMNFGQQARFTLKSTPLCRVLEVVIHTDRGDAGYTFE